MPERRHSSWTSLTTGQKAVVEIQVAHQRGVIKRWAIRRRATATDQRTMTGS